MIEITVREYLSQKLSAKCYMEMPEKQPKRFVLIEKTGSGCENFIFSATFAIQSYAESMLEAAKLNEEVKSAMLAMRALDEICKVSLNSDYNFTDTSQKKYRYQAVFDIKHY